MSLKGLEELHQEFWSNSDWIRVFQNQSLCLLEASAWDEFFCYALICLLPKTISNDGDSLKSTSFGNSANNLCQSFVFQSVIDQVESPQQLWDNVLH